MGNLYPIDVQASATQWSLPHKCCLDFTQELRKRKHTIRIQKQVFPFLAISVAFSPSLNQLHWNVREWLPFFGYHKKKTTLNYGFVRRKIQEGVSHNFLWSMQGIQQRNKSPIKKPAMLFELSPGFRWDSSHFLCSHCLLVTAGGRRVNGTKHNKHRRGLKYLIKFVHIETWNVKQHSNANKTTIYTHANRTKITTAQHFFFFMYLKYMAQENSEHCKILSSL